MDEKSCWWKLDGNTVMVYVIENDFSKIKNKIKKEPAEYYKIENKKSIKYAEQYNVKDGDEDYKKLFKLLKLTKKDEWKMKKK
jgi:hypothetical protein